MFSTPIIHYLLVHGAAEDATRGKASEFQVFSWEWIDLGPVITKILSGPTCVVDIVGSARQRITTRASGLCRHNIIIVAPERLATLPAAPFTVIVTTNDTDEVGRAYLRQHGSTVLHLPNNPIAGETGFDAASIEIYKAWTDRIIAELERTDPENATVLRELGHSEADVPALPTASLSLDGLTTPNDLAVMSAAVSDWRTSAERPPDQIEDRVRQSYNQVRALRQAYVPPEQYPPGLTEFLVVTSGIANDLPAVVPKAARQEHPAFAKAWNRIRYAEGFELPTECDLERPEVASDSWAVAAIQERHAELRAALVNASVEACAQLLPTVPITRSLAGSRSSISKMGNCLRDQRGDWRGHASQFAASAGLSMARAVPEFLLTDLAAIRGTVKVISDDPIELLQVGQLPLSVAHPVVRIPATPGLLFQQLQSYRGPIVLGPQDFEQLLIIRGATPRDPVYPYVERFAGLITQRADVEVTFVDVKNVDELENALSSFDGAMAIFDGHAAHPERSMGRLDVGEETVSFAQMADRRLRFPPITFLAACDTYASGRKGPTVAHAVLGGGATTVIATLGPVGAVESAGLAAELLGLALHLVPHVPGQIRWSELFWLAASVNYAAQGAIELRRRRLVSISLGDVQELSDVARTHLVSFDSDWLLRVWERLSVMSGKSLNEIRGWWIRHAYLTDSVLHCQLGHSDIVFLAPTKTWKGVEHSGGRRYDRRAPTQTAEGMNDAS